MPRLATFIRQNSETIIAEWEGFARTLVPAAENASALSLRNHIVQILNSIANDIDSSQTDAQQVHKSHGEKIKVPLDNVAEIHAALRQAGGFDISQVISEFRALRASVVKLWGSQSLETISQNVPDLTRFNEAIDQTMTESIDYYSKIVEHSRSLFLGVLGHDLRNPIGAMTMAAQLVARLGPLNARQTKLVDQVVKSADRAVESIEHLLDLTRARSGTGLRIVAEPMDMALVASLLVDEMGACYPERTFTLDVSGDTIGDWDKARMGQVFSNLLANAIQYSFADSWIKVAIVGRSKEVSVSVHNKGAPITKDAIGRIFDALIRGESDASDHPSSVHLGLGLYITKEIVTAQRGTITATSTEKDGTTFVARFPRSANEALLSAGREAAEAQPTNHTPTLWARKDGAAA
jgi:signal transduction histidine kinase